MQRTKYLDTKEVNQLLTYAASQSQLSHARQARLEWMVVDLALSTGLRVGEMASLKVKDINFERGYLVVTRLKKRKRVPEILAIGEPLKEHLKDYLRGRADGKLLIGKRGELHICGIQAIWRKVVKKAGLPKMSIHCARHTMATHLLKKTKNLRHVQKQLGHSSPNVTANMYADIAFEDMQEPLNNLYEIEKEQ